VVAEGSSSVTAAALVDAQPRFRGVLHMLAFVAAPPVGIALVRHAPGGSAQVGALVFAASVTAISVSAASSIAVAGNRRESGGSVFSITR
jgi:hypothetical protein